MPIIHQLGAKGFRPFFLLGGAIATVLTPLWVWAFLGGSQPGGVLKSIVWHGHEMIFGFTMAIVAGFLLTAVENWTGRPTVRGVWLLGMAAAWLLARILLWFPGWIGPVVDLAFIPMIVVGIGRPLLATGNRRNAVFLGLLSALWLTNLAIYLDAAGLWVGAAFPAMRTAVHLITVIILAITGRVVPMFTRNATGDATVRSIPALDRLAILSTLLLALVQPLSVPALTAGLAGVAGLATLGRMVGWWTPGVLSRPLLWVLHLGHAAVGLGLLGYALPALGLTVGTAPLHMVTVGGIGLLTLGMMARVSLGHSGRPIQVGSVMSLAFAALALAATVRVFGPWLYPGGLVSWLWLAAGLWTLGFGLFVLRYAGILVSPRVDGKPG